MGAVHTTPLWNRVSHLAFQWDQRAMAGCVLCVGRCWWRPWWHWGHLYDGLPATSTLLRSVFFCLPVHLFVCTSVHLSQSHCVSVCPSFLVSSFCTVCMSQGLYLWTFLFTQVHFMFDWLCLSFCLYIAVCMSVRHHQSVSVIPHDSASQCVRWPRKSVLFVVTC